MKSIVYQCFGLLDLSIFYEHDIVKLHLPSMFCDKRGVGDCYSRSSKLHMYKVFSSGCCCTKYKMIRGVCLCTSNFASTKYNTIHMRTILSNNTDYNMCLE